MIKTISQLAFLLVLFSQCGGIQKAYKIKLEQAFYHKYVTGARGDQGINFAFKLKKVPENYILQKLLVNGVELEYSYDRKSEKVTVEANVLYQKFDDEGREIPIEESKNLYSDLKYKAELIFYDSIKGEYVTFKTDQMKQEETSNYP